MLFLSKIILQAHNTEAFEFVKSHKPQIQAWFCHRKRILTQQQVYHIPLPFPEDSPKEINNMGLKNSFTYTIVMTEPVLEGYADIQQTKFYVTASFQPNGSIRWSDRQDTDNDLGVKIDLPHINDEQPCSSLEIDEQFLANSITHPLSSPLLNSTSSKLNIATSPMHRKNDLASGTITLPAKRVPGFDKTADFMSVWANPLDLARIGVFVGDWIIASNPLTQNLRLVRTHLSSLNHQLSLHSILSHNLGLTRDWGKEEMVTMRAAWFGSNNPPIPIAKQASVARVLSQQFGDGLSHTLALNALRHHLESNTTIVKLDDLISASLYSDTLRFTEAGSPTHTGKEYLERPYEIVDVIRLSRFPPSVSINIEFKIVNLDYHVLVSEKDETPFQLQMAANVGELGCVIDPELTKMMQTGNQHSYTASVGTNTRQLIPRLHSSVRDVAMEIYELISTLLRSAAIKRNVQPSFLLKGSPGIGKCHMIRAIAANLGIHFYEIDCYALMDESDIQSRAQLSIYLDKAIQCSPCVVFLRRVDALSQRDGISETRAKADRVIETLRDCINSLLGQWSLSGYPTVLIGSAPESEKIPLALRALFKQEFLLSAPDEEARHMILLEALENSSLSPDMSVRWLSLQTAALSATDLHELIQDAKLLALERVSRQAYAPLPSRLTSSREASDDDIACAGVCLTQQDFELALASARLSYSQNIQAPSIPSVSWDDVGGLEDVKRDILDTIQLPLEEPEFFLAGTKRRSGVLLYGPPGTGKTMLAKAVATSCSLNFFSVKGPELLNMYIGESEANVRRVFQKARDAKPCVIFFDELDSIAPARGNQGDSGGVMDRIVSQLLSELDGMAASTTSGDIFIIGATNRPDLLDPALLRPGRFDRLLYLGVGETHESQAKIITALTRKFNLDDKLDLNYVAQQCPLNYTGADLYALCSDALLGAMSKKAREIDAITEVLNDCHPGYPHPRPITPQYYLTEMVPHPAANICVTLEDFQVALEGLVPSVSEAEMNHYRELQSRFTRSFSRT